MLRKLLIPIALAALATGNMPAQARVTGDPLTVGGGQIEGIWAQNARVRAYLGVPYAAAPIGDLRWAEPQPVEAWDGVLKADQQPDMCMQTLRTPGSISIEVYGNENLPMSEDCLYLNVWTPADTAPDAKLPVFFWIHGGAFTSGAAAKPEFDGATLAAKGMVVVSINYRLNIFGYFAHPDLTAASPNKSSGNYGGLDQVAALNWARDNIDAFGGDPKKITIAGQSAGGMAVNTLMASPLSRDLMAGAIAQSAGIPAGATKALSSAEADGQKFASMLGNQTIEDLRSLPADVLTALWSDTRVRFGGPVVDGYFLTESLSDTWAAGEQADIPYMPGWSADEFFENIYNRTQDEFIKQATEAAGEERVDELKELYGVTDDETATLARVGFSRDGNFGLNTWNAANWQADAGAPTFVYYWSRRSPFWENQSFQENSPASLLGAYHGSQVPYVFGTLDVLDREFTERDRELSSLWQDYILNFVSTGNPNGDNVPQWPRFTTETEQVLDMGAETKATDLPNRAQMEFFRSFVK
jgi:para-nitrobenzyl esterase